MFLKSYIYVINSTNNRHVKHMYQSGTSMKLSFGTGLPIEMAYASMNGEIEAFSLLYCSSCLNHKKNRYILQIPGLFIPTRIQGGGNHERSECKEGKNYQGRYFDRNNRYRYGLQYRVLCHHRRQGHKILSSSITPEKASIRSGI